MHKSHERNHYVKYLNAVIYSFLLTKTYKFYNIYLGRISLFYNSHTITKFVTSKATNNFSGFIEKKIFYHSACFLQLNRGIYRACKKNTEDNIFSWKISWIFYVYSIQVSLYTILGKRFFSVEIFILFYYVGGEGICTQPVSYIRIAVETSSS